MPLNKPERARTDRHNSPAAITTEVAAQAKLKLGVDYEQGDKFVADGKIYYTARLLGDPIATTLRVFDAIGFYTKTGTPRWVYLAIPKSVWVLMDAKARKQTVYESYLHEGGTEMKGLFA